MARRVMVLAVAVLTLSLASACGLLGIGGTKQKPVAAAADEASAPAVPLDSVEVADSPTPSRSPSHNPTKKATAKASPSKSVSSTPSEDPNNFEPPACAKYEGKAVSKSSAKAALNAAAAKRYWPKSAPGLAISADLMHAIAWNESGWQSNIVNCDGGYGLMQVMPDTVSMINQRFGATYVATDYRQNAEIGANYLAWITKYVADNHFGGNYNMSASKCASTSSWCLLNAVIAAYHAGVGTIDDAASAKKLPVTDYVYVVRSLMRSCFCDRY